MNKIFAPFLPPWVETGLQPAFYDMESGTVLQQTARMYAKVQQLTRLFNELSEETKTTVEEYIAKFIELKDFVDDYFENLDVQEEINNKLDQMAEDGTLADIIANFIEGDITIIAPALTTSGDLTVLDIRKNNEHKYCIVDFGSYTEENYSLLVASLVEHGITKFDYAFISHYHNDHVGNLSYMIADARFDFSECLFYLPTTPDYTRFIGSARYIPDKENEVKQMLNTAGITFKNPTDSEVLNILDAVVTFKNSNTADFETYYSDTVLSEDIQVTNYNNFSMVVQIALGDSRVLFTGDIEDAAESVIASKLDTPDVLKIEHHAVSTHVNKKYLGIVKSANIAFAEGGNDRQGVSNYCLLFNGSVIKTPDSGDIVIRVTRNSQGYISKTGSNSLNYAQDYLIYTPFIIQESTDLDDIKEAGIYSTNSGTITNTLSNCPFADSVIKLKVEQLTINRIKQIATRVLSNNKWERTFYNNVWSEWRNIADGTLPPALSSGDDLNDLIFGKFSYAAEIASTLVHAPTTLGNRRGLITHQQIDGSSSIQKIEIVDADEVENYYRQHTSLGWTDWFREGTQPLNIAKNTDLNNLVVSGTYCSTSGTISQTLSNAPADAGSYAFNLVVRKGTSAADRYIQEITIMRSPMKIYRRVKANTGWTHWYEINLTAINS